MTKEEKKKALWAAYEEAEAPLWAAYEESLKKLEQEG